MDIIEHSVFTTTWVVPHLRIIGIHIMDSAEPYLIVWYLPKICNSHFFLGSQSIHNLYDVGFFF